MDRTARVLSLVGARPNFMKIGPLHRVMRRSSAIRPYLVHTGQHYDWEMSEVFFQDLGISQPDFELDVGSGSHAYQTAEVMLRLEPVIEQLRPDLVVVVGDVNSTLGAAITARKLNVTLAHVEAGLRSEDRSMPEEINRILTDAISDVLFAPSPDAVENLRAEGIAEERIHLVGNIMIDALKWARSRAERSDVLSRVGLRPRGYVLVTLHRPSNVDDPDDLERACSLLESVARSVPVVFVAHPRTRAQLEARDLIHRIATAGVRTIPPLGYVDFVRLMMDARCVVTDSGGVQEETTVLGVPCMTMRTTTERPVTITHGTNRLVGTDPRTVAQAVLETLALDDPPPRQPPLWDGHTADRIVSVLERLLGMSA